MNRKLTTKNQTTKKVVEKKDSEQEQPKQLSVQPLKREGSYWINPLDIVVDFKDKSGNPRLDYGSDWEDFKDSIKTYGVQQAIKLYLNEATGAWHLAHGFRRMKAVVELIEAGVKIEQIPFDQVANDEVQILIEHFTLNTGKPLNDVEMAEGIKRLQTLSQNENLTDVAKKVNIDYQKAHNLVTFIKKAGSRIKDAVSSGEISFHVGSEIVKKSKNISEQLQMLKEGKENAKAEGKQAVRTKHIPKINKANIPFEVRLQMALSEALKFENVNPELTSIFTKIIDAVKNNKDISEVAQLLSLDLVEETEMEHHD